MKIMYSIFMDIKTPLRHSLLFIFSENTFAGFVQRNKNI